MLGKPTTTLLQELVSPNQRAFTPSRMITDNALVVFECIHAIHSHRYERSKFCSYKLDLSKAYDRVDWEFPQALLKLGFHETWVRWVMTCVTTGRYMVRFNWLASGPFELTQGLRQGDPLAQGSTRQ